MKEKTDNGRTLKISIAVSEEERKRIKKAVIEDRKKRSMSDIGRDLLLEYAEKYEKTALTMKETRKTKKRKTEESGTDEE